MRVGVAVLVLRLGKRWLVSQFVCLSVGWSVGWSVDWTNGE